MTVGPELTEEEGIGTSVHCIFRIPESSEIFPVEYLDLDTVLCPLLRLKLCLTLDCLGIGRLDTTKTIIQDIVLKESYVRSTTSGMEKI